MSNDKMRDEFEVAIAADVGISVSDIQRCRKEETYTTDALYYAWWAWQASREALVIQLPCSRADKGELANGDGGRLSALVANQLAIDECRAAIEAAGLKVSS